MSRQEYCQSCGMPLSETTPMGTEKNGLPSDEYCSHCYQDGEFTYQGDMEGLIAFCIPHYLAQFPNTTEEAAWEFFRKFYPTLKRWRPEVDLEAKATELLAKCPMITLASVSEDGYPRPCVLAKLEAADGFKKIYVATGKSSRKTPQFRANPKAGVSFFNGGDGVSATGTVRILDDRAESDRYWQDWMYPHFPGGAADPDFCVLEFSAEEVVFYIDGIFETRSYRK